MAPSIVKITQMSNHMSRVLSCVFSSKRYLALCAGTATLYVTRSQLCSAAVELHTDQKMTTPANMDRKMLESKFSWMDRHAPCFGMRGSDITVIQDPVDFYETFKRMVGGANKRIVIASLYLGTGVLEKQLVEAIEMACSRAADSGGGEKFEVLILLDYNRGSRGVQKSSRTMLLPLLQKYKDSVHVTLYHTPDLRGWLKKYVPERFNETVGLNHMKIYMVDNDFIISGANLSDSYFTNRQDRYIHFKSNPGMANYLHDIVKAVSTISFHLNDDNTTSYPDGVPHPYEGEDNDRSTAYKGFARETIMKVKNAAAKANTLESQEERTPTVTESCDYDTWLFPFLQMGPFNIKDDEEVTKRLFKNSEESDKIYLASGYFNLTSDFINVILSESKAGFEILTASPQANGFYGASGISHYVPAAYTHIARQFYNQVSSLHQDKRISVHEYYRPYWSFHCKGLWYYLPNSSLPALTFIGSPNFGYRSMFRDLECQVAVMTTNVDLQNQLKQEHERLYNSSCRVTEATFQQDERYVPLWARVVTGIIKNFF